MKLSSAQTDSLKELINIDAGQAATMLNDMVEVSIHLSASEVLILNAANSLKEEDVKHKQKVATKLGFTGAIRRTGMVVFPLDCAKGLARTLTGEDPEASDFDDTMEEAITEVGNLVVNGVVGSIANITQQRIDYLPPQYLADSGSYFHSLAQAKDSLVGVLGQTQFNLKELNVDGKIFLFFEKDSFDALVDALDVRGAKG